MHSIAFQEFSTVSKYVQYHFLSLAVKLMLCISLDHLPIHRP